MSTFTITRWRCDRCGAEMDKRPHTTPKPYVSIGYGYDEGPGPSVEWREFCQPCATIVERQIDAMLKQDVHT